MRYLLTFLIFILCISCKSKPPYTEDIKLELKKMYIDDQNLQKYDLKKVVRKEYSDSMENEFNLLCRKNTIELKKYLKDYGFPGIKENGKEIDLYFWVLAQHADHDVSFQKKVLKSLKKELNKKNANPKYYAFLYDRVKKNENKPQLYGTQISWETGKPILYKVQNPKELNQRRKMFGLEPIEEYLKNF